MLRKKLRCKLAQLTLLFRRLSLKFYYLGSDHLPRLAVTDYFLVSFAVPLRIFFYLHGGVSRYASCEKIFGEEQSVHFKGCPALNMVQLTLLLIDLIKDVCPIRDKIVASS